MTKLETKISKFVEKSLFTLTSLLKVPVGLIREKFPKELRKERNRPALITGNGPSFSRVLKKDTHFLYESDVFVVNYFNESGVLYEVKPRYWTLLDAAFFISNIEDKSELHLTKKSFNVIQNRRKNLYNTLKKINFKIDFFIPSVYKNSYGVIKLKEISQKNPNIKVNFFNYLPSTGFLRLLYPFWDKNILSPYSQTVTIISLYLAILSGYKTIYLSGIDHNFLTFLKMDKDNNVYHDELPYFWGTFTKKIVFHNMDYREQLAGQIRLFNQYFELKDFAEWKGIKIYNLALESYVQAFTKI